MIKLEYDNPSQLSDLVRDGGNLETDDTFYTAVLISLFTRRRARSDDALPDPLDQDRGGYWGDSYPGVEGDLIGSRLWLLNRSKTTNNTLNLAKTYSIEALQWMIDDGIAKTINVVVERQSQQILAIQVQIEKPGDVTSRWENTWNAHLALL